MYSMDYMFCVYAYIYIYMYIYIYIYICMERSQTTEEWTCIEQIVLPKNGQLQRALKC